MISVIRFIEFLYTRLPNHKGILNIFGKWSIFCFCHAKKTFSVGKEWTQANLIIWWAVIICYLGLLNCKNLREQSLPIFSAPRYRLGELLKFRYFGIGCDFYLFVCFFYLLVPYILSGKNTYDLNLKLLRAKGLWRFADCIYTEAKNKK